MTRYRIGYHVRGEKRYLDRTEDTEEKARQGVDHANDVEDESISSCPGGPAHSRWFYEPFDDGNTLCG
jgi:hypothetical protein